MHSCLMPEAVLDRRLQFDEGATVISPPTGPIPATNRAARQRKAFRG